MIHDIDPDELGRIFLATPVPICAVDREIRILAANAKYAELCGASLERLRGRSMTDFCPANLIEDVRNNFRIVDAGGSLNDRQIDFSGRTHLVSASPIMAQDGMIMALSVALVDLSKQKTTEEVLEAANGMLLGAYQDMREQAETDALTGLMNRYGLDIFFDREIRRCRREAHPISVAIIDVDYFKLFNDRHGHLRGDQCLQRVARAVQSEIRRPGDCVARYGGEEFVVVLPNTTSVGAAQVAENIATAIGALNIAHQDSAFDRITVSIGIADLPFVARDLDPIRARNLLMVRADKALYLAKRRGRNRLHIWSEGDPSSMRTQDRIGM